MENHVLSRNAKLGLLALVMFCVLAYLLRAVIIPVAFSFLLAYFLDPVLDRLEERRLSRNVGILIFLAFAIAAFVIFLLIFIPLIEGEIQRFLSRLPGLVAAFQEKVGPWLKELTGREVPAIMDQLTENATLWLGSLSASDMAPVTRVIGGTFSGTAAAIKVLVTLVMIPIFTFYFLRDFDTLKLIPLEYVPPRHREKVVDVFREIDEVLSGFIRGQGTVCLILAVLYAIGYAVSGVPLGLLIGLIAGALAFVPYLGAAVGLVMSLVLVLLDWQGFGPLIGVVITFGIVSTLESFVVTPKIVGDKVGLSPVAVMIALFIGGELLGFAGILIAVPLTAVLNILWRRAKARYRDTAFFTGG